MHTPSRAQNGGKQLAHSRPPNSPRSLCPFLVFFVLRFLHCPHPPRPEPSPALEDSRVRPSAGTWDTCLLGTKLPPQPWKRKPPGSQICTHPPPELDTPQTPPLLRPHPRSGGAEEGGGGEKRAREGGGGGRMGGELERRSALPPPPPACERRPKGSARN